MRSPRRRAARLWPYERQLDGFARLLARCRRQGVPVVYELDDNLLDLHSDEPWETYPGDTLRAVVAFLARQADGMIVSTPAIAERMAHLRSEVLVVPNALDERLFGSAPEPLAPRSSTLTIGYMGTLTHEADLRMVLAPLRAILKRHAGRVRLELAGGVEGRRTASLFEGLPFRMRDPGNEDPYPKFVPVDAEAACAGTSRSRRSRTTRSRGGSRTSSISTTRRSASRASSATSAPIATRCGIARRGSSPGTNPKRGRPHSRRS